jgi:hypothetical protein
MEELEKIEVFVTKFTSTVESTSSAKDVMLELAEVCKTGMIDAKAYKVLVLEATFLKSLKALDEVGANKSASTSAQKKASDKQIKAMTAANSFIASNKLGLSRDDIFAPLMDLIDQKLK